MMLNGMLFLLALSSGLLLALAGLASAMLLLGLLLMGFVWVLSWNALFALLMVLVFVVVGPLQYMLGFGKAFWLPYLFAMMMTGRAVVQYEAAQTPQWASTLALRRALRWALGLSLLFASTALASSALNQVPLVQWFVSGKEYLALWVLPCVMALGLLNPSKWTYAPHVAAVWLCVQLPLVFWQRFGVAPQRGGESPWDAVVGLFAGNAWGGGGSGAMAMVSLSAAAMVALAWRRKMVRGYVLLLSVLAALAACAMAEVKLTWVLLPMLMLGVAWVPATQDVALAKPVLMASVFAVLAAVAMVWLYQQQYTSKRSIESDSVLAYGQQIVGRSMDTSIQADEWGQLSRIGALRFWWQRQNLGDMAGWLVGHGMGATRKSAMATGEVARKYPFDLGRTTAAIWLWEIGLLGTMAGVLALAAFALLGGYLSIIQATWNPASAWNFLLPTASLSLGVVLISIPYSADLMEAPHLPTWALLMVGVVWAAARQKGVEVSP